MHRTGRRTLGVVVSGLVLILSLLASHTAGAAVTASYTGGGTVVVEQAGENPDDPRVDQGTLVCSGATGDGAGGACIAPDGGQDGILVNDDMSGQKVAFQVCIDANGDGICSSKQLDHPLAFDCKAGIDIVVFSHDDLGLFHNPLGPLPPASTRCPGAEGKGFQGYVVFLCEGVHVVQQGSDGGRGPGHTHEATKGTVTATPDGSPYTGYGNFCGGLKDQVNKPYIVV